MNLLFAYLIFCYLYRFCWSMLLFRGRYASGRLDLHFAAEELVFFVFAPVVVPLQLVARCVGMGGPL